MSRIMPDCRETHRLVVEGMDRELGVIERLRVKAHLAMCASCGNFVKQMKLLREAFRRYPGPGDD